MWAAKRISKNRFILQLAALHPSCNQHCAITEYEHSPSSSVSVVVLLLALIMLGVELRNAAGNLGCAANGAWRAWGFSKSGQGLSEEEEGSRWWLPPKHPCLGPQVTTGQFGQTRVRGDVAPFMANCFSLQASNSSAASFACPDFACLIFSLLHVFSSAIPSPIASEEQHHTTHILHRTSSWKSRDGKKGSFGGGVFLKRRMSQKKSREPPIQTDCGIQGESDHFLEILKFWGL